MHLRHPQVRRISNRTKELPMEKKAEEEEECGEEKVRDSKQVSGPGRRVFVQNTQRDQGLGRKREQPGVLGLPPPPSPFFFFLFLSICHLSKP